MLLQQGADAAAHIDVVVDEENQRFSRGGVIGGRRRDRKRTHRCGGAQEMPDGLGEFLHLHRLVDRQAMTGRDLARDGVGDLARQDNGGDVPMQPAAHLPDQLEAVQTVGKIEIG